MAKIDLKAIQARLDAKQPLPSELQQGTERFTAQSLPAKHPMWTLWSRFSEIYGHQWASQQGDEPNDTWIRGLDGVSNEQLGTGLRALLSRTDTWPPNLIEFRQLCTGDDNQAWRRQAHNLYKPEAMIEDLTKKEQTAKVARETLAQLKEQMK